MSRGRGEKIGEGGDEEEEEDTQNKYNRDNRETQTVCLRPLSINLPLLRYIYFL